MKRILNAFRRKDVISGCEEAAPRSLAEASNYLAGNLYQLLAEEKGNIFFSPFCVSTTMAMLLCAAEEETEYEMRAVLGYDLTDLKREEIISSFEHQLSLLRNLESYTLFCVNSMLCRKSFDVKDKYRQIVTRSFKAFMLELDFEKENRNVVKHINGWTREKTNNMIPNLVQFLDPKSSLVLLNAVHFKGTWEIKFKESPCPQNFYNKGMEDSVKRVEVVQTRERFFFFQNETAKALLLPYTGEKLSMLILLPHEKDGLMSLEADLTPSSFHDVMNELRECEVQVSLPRFRLEYSKCLAPCFKRLGIKRVFDCRASMSIANDSSSLCLSGVYHRAVLELNEEDIEAEPAVEDIRSSVIRSRYYTPPLPEIFHADHPFLFIIYDTRNDLILFMGRVEEL